MAGRERGKEGVIIKALYLGIIISFSPLVCLPWYHHPQISSGFTRLGHARLGRDKHQENALLQYTWAAGPGCPDTRAVHSKGLEGASERVSRAQEHGLYAPFSSPLSQCLPEAEDSDWGSMQSPFGHPHMHASWEFSVRRSGISTKM